MVDCRKGIIFMKKSLLTLFVLFLFISLAACSKNEDIIQSAISSDISNGLQETQGSLPTQTTSPEATDSIPSIPSDEVPETHKKPILESRPTLLSADYLNNMLSHVYEVSSSSCAVQDEFNHSNLIVDRMTETTDSKASKIEDIQIGNKTSNLSYQRTLIYPVGDLKLHEYTIDGSENGTVCFKETGELYSILGDSIAQIEVDPLDSSDTVLAALKPAISQYVDFVNYQYVDVERSGLGDKDFMRYRFLCYNTENGYRTDWFSVCVSSDGLVYALKINNADSDAVELCAGVNSDVNAEIVLEKLTDIYNTTTTGLVDYEIYDKRVISYEGAPCVEYTIGCQIQHIVDDAEFGTACVVVIPLQILLDATNEATTG